MNLQKTLLFLFFFNFFLTNAQDTLSSIVRLINGKKSSIIHGMPHIKIHTSYDNDSITERIQVYELALLKDTIIVKPVSYIQFSNKINSTQDVMVKYYPFTRERIKIPILNIDRIEKINRINYLMHIAEAISLIVGVIGAPLISFGNNYKPGLYSLVAGTSLGVLAVSLTVDNIWGKSIYWIRKHKNKKVWTIG